MMINQKQIWLYWREWNAAKKELERSLGIIRSPRVLGPTISSPSRPSGFVGDEKRHELHVRALGYDKSHAKFSNSELDKVLAEFRAISNPANLETQLNAINGRKTRLIFGIRRTLKKLGCDENYAEAIASQMFDRKGALDIFTEAELEKVRIALAKQVIREGSREPALTE